MFEEPHEHNRSSHISVQPLQVKSTGEAWALKDWVRRDPQLKMQVLLRAEKSMVEQPISACTGQLAGPGDGKIDWKAVSMDSFLLESYEFDQEIFMEFMAVF